MIDLRTDVMAPPTDAMWEAMRNAQLGWPLFGEDRSINELQALAAGLLDKEAALLVPTCSVANLLALMTLGQRGTQVILDATAHIVWSEEWGVVSIAGLFPRLLPCIGGAPDPAELERALVEMQYGYRPRTSLVCLENTHNNAGGTILTPERTDALAAIAHQHGAAVHLDGARLFNAAVALEIPASRLAQSVDTVSLSLNKGLCAPEGALLVGTRETVEAAKTNARRIGAASMHKAGIFAAAGIVALTTMIDQLREDNRRARRLAEGLARLPALSIDLETVQSNIILADTSPSGLPARRFADRLASQGVLALPRSDRLVRFVTHRMIGDEEVERSVAAVESVDIQPALSR